ncbi:MAG: flagellar motor switch phosphatase FliY [Oscillospiraceae bacterium]|jgi:flagellar motor switch protein FliN/FliY|nr:flagellar motor switch phosphatase FliY [Oscillospiraceae bacterium]
MSLSQSEIDQMLGISAPEGDGELSGVRMGEMIVDGEFDRERYALSAEEKDVLGEVGNICMGAVATTMYTLLDRPVRITTPRVSVHTTREVLSAYQVPFVIVEVMYVSGIDGKNVLLLKESDAALITDLLMGGEGVVSDPIELSELHMSAVSEIMNQMIGASANSLSQIIHESVDISTPNSGRVALDGDVSGYLDESDILVRISFDMEIDGLLRSQLLQLMPYDLARNLAARVMGSMAIESNFTSAEAFAIPPDPAATSAASATPAYAQAPASAQPAYAQAPASATPAYAQAPASATPAYAQAPASATPAYAHSYAQVPEVPVDIRAMSYPSFGGGGAQGFGAAPLGFGMVQDIPLKVSVELGRTTKQISEILDFSTGTVIVLEKTVGDPVEIMANGKLIARGEVVAIDENYGVRITDIFT